MRGWLAALAVTAGCNTVLGLDPVGTERDAATSDRGAAPAAIENHLEGHRGVCDVEARVPFEAAVVDEDGREREHHLNTEGIAQGEAAFEGRREREGAVATETQAGAERYVVLRSVVEAVLGTFFGSGGTTERKTRKAGEGDPAHAKEIKRGRPAHRISRR